MFPVVYLDCPPHSSIELVPYQALHIGPVQVYNPQLGAFEDAPDELSNVVVFDPARGTRYVQAQPGTGRGQYGPA